MISIGVFVDVILLFSTDVVSTKVLGCGDEQCRDCLICDALQPVMKFTIESFADIVSLVEGILYMMAYMKSEYLHFVKPISIQFTKFC